MARLQILLDREGALRDLFRQAYKAAGVPLSSFPRTAPPGGGVVALAAEAVIKVDEDAQMIIAFSEHGMSSGLPSVAIGFPLPDGRAVWAETSLRLFLQAADAAREKYGNVHETHGEGLRWEADLHLDPMDGAHQEDIPDRTLDVMRRAARPVSSMEVVPRVESSIEGDSILTLHADIVDEGDAIAKRSGKIDPFTGRPVDG